MLLFKKTRTSLAWMLAAGNTPDGLSKRTYNSRTTEQLTSKQKRIDNYFNVAEVCE